MSRSRLTCLVVLLAAGAASRSAQAAFHRFTYVSGVECHPADPQTDRVTYSEAGIKVVDQSPDPTAEVSLICPVPWTQDNFLPWAQPGQKISIRLYMARDPVPVSASTGTGLTEDPGCMGMASISGGGRFYLPTVTIIDPGSSNPIYVMEPVPPVPMAAGAVYATAFYCDGVTSGMSIIGYSVDVCFAPDLSSC